MNQDTKSPKKNRFPIIAIVIIVTAVIHIFFFWVIPGIQKSRRESDLNFCYNNIQRLAFQLDLYKRTEGHYPDSLSVLVPVYFDRIPHCPTADKDTYSDGYETDSENNNFTLYCKGSHHNPAGVPDNHPVYSSREGLVKKR